MKNLFVPNELAIKLKEKGFNEPCIAYYAKKLTGFPLRVIWEEQLTSPIFNSYYYGACAPMYQQVVDWFRDKHEIYIYIDSTMRPNIKNKAEKTLAEFKVKSNSKYYEYSGSEYYHAMNGAINESLKLI